MFSQTEVIGPVSVGKDNQFVNEVKILKILVITVFNGIHGIVLSRVLAHSGEHKIWRSEIFTGCKSLLVGS